MGSHMLSTCGVPVDRFLFHGLHIAEAKARVQVDGVWVTIATSSVVDADTEVTGSLTEYTDSWTVTLWSQRDRLPILLSSSELAKRPPKGAHLAVITDVLAEPLGYEPQEMAERLERALDQAGYQITLKEHDAG